MRFHGIDPGLKGAWAVLSPDCELLELDDLPHVKNRLDIRTMLEWAETVDEDDLVAVEAPFRRQRGKGLATSLTNFGRLLAAFEAVQARIVQVPSGRWKNALGLEPGGTYDQRKKRAVILARQIFGRTFGRHDEAEAALIAEWARRHGP